MGLRINDVNDANRILIERAPEVIKALTLMSQARVYQKTLDESTSVAINAHDQFIKYKALALKIHDNKPLSDEDLKMVSKLPWENNVSTIDAEYMSPIQREQALKMIPKGATAKRFLGMIAWARMYYYRNASRDAQKAQSDLAKRLAESTKQYHDILDPLQGKAEETPKTKTEGNGEGGKHGRQEDTRLKSLKEWFDKEKDFLSIYEKLAELYGKKPL